MQIMPRHASRRPCPPRTGRDFTRPVSAMLAGIALLATGCGAASSTTTTTSSPQDGASAAFRFSACMRQHGVPNFPDPRVTTTPGNQSVMVTLPAGVHGTPAFRAAQQSCRGILPAPSKGNHTSAAAQAAHRLGLLAFARCVRTHGINDFPDPNAQGQMTSAMLAAAGVDVHAPSVLSAAKACISASQGAVTAAGIARAASSAP